MVIPLRPTKSGLWRWLSRFAGSSSPCVLLTFSLTSLSVSLKPFSNGLPATDLEEKACLCPFWEFLTSTFVYSLSSLLESLSFAVPQVQNDAERRLQFHSHWVRPRVLSAIEVKVCTQYLDSRPHLTAPSAASDGKVRF
jgi:hypothetical protein